MDLLLNSYNFDWNIQMILHITANQLRNSENKMARPQPRVNYLKKRSS